MSWFALGDSMTGTSHRARNTPCQDAMRFGTFGPDNEWLVIAVADGAGSASHADKGAELACNEFVNRVRSHSTEALFTREGMTNLFESVRQALITEAERLGVSPRDCACTALVAVVGPASIAIGQVGDGAIVLGDGERYRTVFWPDPAEFANCTDFLTDERFAEALQFDTSTEPIAEVAVLTDGLQRLALDFATRTPHDAFFRPLFAGVRSAVDLESLFEPLRAFLDSPRVNQRTDDDKTLVLALRRP